MSLSALLIPMAIALTVSAADVSKDVVEKLQNKDEEVPEKTLAETKGIATRFNDSRVLYKTLNTHGLKIMVNSDDDIVVKCSGGILNYRRSSASEPYTVYVKDVNNSDELIRNIKCLNDDYCENIQQYTCESVKEGLEPNMHIEEEKVLEDNSILLTISIDE